MSRIATVIADGLHLRDGPGIEFDSAEYREAEREAEAEYRRTLAAG